MWAWLSKIINAPEVVEKTFSGIGSLAKDVKTICTGKIDPIELDKILLKAGELEVEFAKMQAQTLTSEETGNSLQRNWRPITMLAFLVLIFLNQFNVLVIPLSNEIWALFKIGLGGYVAGRSLEKIVGKN